MTKQNFILEIPKRGKTCSKGDEHFDSGNEYFSALIDSEEGYLRRDFCTKCWENHAKEDITANARSFWKSHVPVKNEKLLDDRSREERALEILKEAVAGNSPEEQLKAFVLALFLVRKKQLVFRQEIEQDGFPVNLYEHTSTEEIICVKRVDISLIQIEKVQQELAKELSLAKT